MKKLESMEELKQGVRMRMIEDVESCMDGDIHIDVTGTVVYGETKDCIGDIVGDNGAYSFIADNVFWDTCTWSPIVKEDIEKGIYTVIEE